MKETIVVRMLVPCTKPDGQIEYHLEHRFLRLPLKRTDRLALQERMEELPLNDNTDRMIRLS